MIINKIPEQSVVNEGFAFNVVNNIDTLLQLLMSDAIWKRQGVSDKAVKIEQKLTKNEKNLKEISYYLNGEVVMIYKKIINPTNYTILLCPK